MSLPATNFYCTKCDFLQGDARTWGTKEYLLPNGVRLLVDWRLGWCEDCVGLAAVESLKIDNRRKKVEKAEQEFARHPPRPVRRWWHLHRFVQSRLWRLRVEDWEQQSFYLTSTLDDARDTLDLLGQRKNPPRCLTCGSTRVVEPLVQHREAWDDLSQTKATGFIHPGCGGELWMIDSGLRFIIWQMVRRYTAEGDFIAEEDISGYSKLQIDYYSERAILNTRARGKVIPEVLVEYGQDALRQDSVSE
jgi:hypothetical protein